MGELIDTATAILSQAQRRVELSAQNVANLTTYGYKRRISFENLLLTDPSNADQAVSNASRFDLTPGKLVPTGTPTDLAFAGSGFLVALSPAGPVYTRGGQFQREATGRLLTSQGWVLQAEAGGDIVLRDGPFEVGGDGMILQAGEPVAKIAVVDLPEDTALVDIGGGFVVGGDARPVRSTSAGVRQGMLEASNVSTGDEMVAIMEALRRAEAGQRLVNVYDDLMGRAIGQFGGS